MKHNKTIKIINYSGATLIILAIVLMMMTGSDEFVAIKNMIIPKRDSSTINFEIEGLTQLQQGFLTFRDKMIGLENTVARFGNNGYRVMIIILLFALKSVLPLVPISATCLLSGALLPFPIAMLVNIIGLSGLMAIKYYFGTKLGGGNIEKILKRYPEILALLERDGSGNPWLLFIFRLVPSFPLNPISQLYGSMGFKFWNYMMISIVGFMLKIVSFTMIGSNVYEPLSFAFILPIIIILFISGISMLLVNTIISVTSKKKDGDKVIENIKNQNVQGQKST